MNKIFWCKSCLNMSTRPRITFDSRGWCNACQWAEKKKNFKFNPRIKEFKKLIKKIRKLYKSPFDCIVPVSGGKDGSYVSYILKKKFGLNPLTITSRPPLTMDVGEKNLNNFVRSGFDHIHITPNEETMRKVNKYGFIKMGFPYYGWLISIFTSIIKTATQFKIPLIVYGEDGEIEYGGSKENLNTLIFGSDYIEKIYFESGYKKVMNAAKLTKQEMFWFELPKRKDNFELYLTHWSKYENWDPYDHYLVAKNNCGLQESKVQNSGTFTNFAQTDQDLYALHTYLCYLKFGFGRATQDAGIEIRRKAMTRDQGLNLVKAFDGMYPESYIKKYLEYYKMSKSEFNKVLDKWANKKLFTKNTKSGIWEPKFTIGEDFFYK